jgi:hypothetical protein
MTRNVLEDVGARALPVEAVARRLGVRLQTTDAGGRRRRFTLMHWHSEVRTA